MTAINKVTGAILIGGESRRMGQDKANLPFDGKTLVERVHERIAPLVDEVFLVVRPDRLQWAKDLAPAGVRTITDRVKARGPLAGIHAALSEATNPRVLVVACDMPELQPSLLAGLLADDSAEVVVPRTEHGFEPLLAVYAKSCLSAVEQTLAGGPSRIPAFYDKVSVSEWNESKLRQLDPDLRSLVNVNRPEDLPE